MTEIDRIKLWKEICFLLKDSVSASMNEELFVQRILSVLEKLGWSQFQKEIITEKSIQIGRQGSIRPDILVKCNESGKSFVIEAKS